MTTARLLTDRGTRIALDVGRWHGGVDEAEVQLLAALADPVLDVGCGPGRIVEALAAAGRPALGIDPAVGAWRHVARRGVPVLRRSVFEPLPAEGRWGTALLLDGNVGIGGDPVALLCRIGALLRPGGEVVAELERRGEVKTMTVRLEANGTRGPRFPWATVGADGWRGAATAAGLAGARVASMGMRWFGWATRP